jgi:hypothetical protein
MSLTEYQRQYHLQRNGWKYSIHKLKVYFIEFKTINMRLWSKI